MVNRVVKKSDWKTEPMPAKHQQVACVKEYSPEEFNKIKSGVKPKVMEDKWFIYFEDNRLYFHRSWTGYCIYVVEFETCENKNRISSITINQDPEQSIETDTEWNVKFVLYLIDLFFLDKGCKFPRKNNTSGPKDAIFQWGLVGRELFKGHTLYSNKIRVVKKGENEK